MAGYLIQNLEGKAYSDEGKPCQSPGALSLASPGVPGNCRKQCSVPREAPWGHHGRTRGTDGDIERACVVRYFRQKHDGRNHYETNDLCKSCNSMIVLFAHFILIIKHVL